MEVGVDDQNDVFDVAVIGAARSIIERQIVGIFQGRTGLITGCIRDIKAL